MHDVEREPPTPGARRHEERLVRHRAEREGDLVHAHAFGLRKRRHPAHVAQHERSRHALHGGRETGHALGRRGNGLGGRREMVEEVPAAPRDLAPQVVGEEFRERPQVAGAGHLADRREQRHAQSRRPVVERLREVATQVDGTGEHERRSLALAEAIARRDEFGRADEAVNARALAPRAANQSLHDGCLQAHGHDARPGGPALAFETRQGRRTQRRAAQLVLSGAGESLPRRAAERLGNERHQGGLRRNRPGPRCAAARLPRRVQSAGPVERRCEAISLEPAGALGQHGEVHRRAAVEEPEEGLGAVQRAGKAGLHGREEGCGPPVCPRSIHRSVSLRKSRDGYSQWGV